MSESSENRTMTDLEWRKLQAAESNHIWLSAFACINPTMEFRLGLADEVLRWLNDKDRLVPACEGRLGELTPMLYLSINKS